MSLLLPFPSRQKKISTKAKTNRKNKMTLSNKSSRGPHTVRQRKSGGEYNSVRSKSLVTSSCLNGAVTALLKAKTRPAVASQLRKYFCKKIKHVVNTARQRAGRQLSFLYNAKSVTLRHAAHEPYECNRSIARAMLLLTKHGPWKLDSV